MDYVMKDKLELHTVCDGVWFFYTDIDEPRTFEVEANVHGGNKLSLFIYTQKKEIIEIEYELPIPKGTYMNVVQFAGRGQVVGFIYDDEKIVNKHPAIVRGKIVMASD